MGNVSPAPNSMRPPFGIPLIFVEHVYIDFTLSSLQTHPVGTQERTAPIEGLCTDMLFTVFEPQHEFRPVLPDFSANSFLSGQVQLPSSNENPMQSFATQDPNSNFSCRAHSLAASIHSLNWSSLGDVLPDANWQFSQNKTTSLADGIFFTNFIRLIDAGLRSMISRNITPVCEEIKLTLDSNRPKLAEIAPALFSPGYLQVSPKSSKKYHSHKLNTDRIRIAVFKTRSIFRHNFSHNPNGSSPHEVAHPAEENITPIIILARRIRPR